MSDRLPRPEPRDAFRRSLRSRLMAEAAVTLQPRETSWAAVRRGWPRPALAAAAVVLVVALGAGSAAADSLPGDFAFGLKRATEELQLSLALDDSTKLKTLADQADHRLAELARASSDRPAAARPASAAFTAAVQRFTAAVVALRGKPGASEDKRAEAQDVADAASAKHEAVLVELERRASPETKPDIERAKNEVDEHRPSDRPINTPESTRTPASTRTPES
ncbi:MAG TPA: DUF5667 domain-containing protein, partial [Candidatus Limnocylindria bacterium]|nr:DUF5667 domain-containing protein [Candidatus Limnocylindria bacterium]